MWNVLDAFSGTGGFSLGLERAGGFKTRVFCENAAFPRKVLKKHWPAVPIYTDIRRLTKERLEADGLLPIDVICGGFPCQDISDLGSRIGIEGAKSGLWKEMARLIGEIRPRWVIIENVRALRQRGLGTVLQDLAAVGYDAEWETIRASAVGAPHARDRMWIVANPIGERPVGPVFEAIRKILQDGSRSASGNLWRKWPPEPDVPRMADGLPHQLDRNRSLGNAVVPKFVELIGRAIIKVDEAARRDGST
jgi:DNA (cytosine-5)-methyltransferase 1